MFPNTILTHCLLQAVDPETHLLFRSDRIYAVLTVVLLVFGGLVLGLLRQESRLRRLEQSIGNQPAESDSSTETQRKL
jgi:hypothetical protein